jgi:hypothetical protein
VTGLFGHLPRSRPPRRLMKVHDVADESGCLVEMRCKRGHRHHVTIPAYGDEAGPGEHTVTEVKRGLPCPTCAEQAIAGG